MKDRIELLQPFILDYPIKIAPQNIRPNKMTERMNFKCMIKRFYHYYSILFTIQLPWPYSPDSNLSPNNK